MKKKQSMRWGAQCVALALSMVMLGGCVAEPVSSRAVSSAAPSGAVLSTAASSSAEAPKIEADVESLEFYTTVRMQIPQEYNAAGGVLPIEEIGSFWLVCNTYWYLRDTGVYDEEDYDVVVPAADVQKMVEWRFGIAGYDVTQLPDYDVATNGFAHICAHDGDTGPIKLMRESQEREDGTVEVIIDFYNHDMEDYTNTENWIWERSQRCVVRQLDLGAYGIIYTLLESEAVDPPTEEPELPSWW